MANGLAGLQPFPQFAPGGEGGLIPSIQMPASNVSAMFPRTSGGGGGRRDVNPLAGFAPYGISWLADKLAGAPTEERAPPPSQVPQTGPITLADIQEELGGKSTAEASYLADQIYGPQTSRKRSWAKPLLDIAGAAAFRDPAEQAAYLKSYGDIAATKATRGTGRQEFIANYVKQQRGKALNPSNAYLSDGSGINRRAIESPSGGFYILSQGLAEDVDSEGTAIDRGSYYRNPDYIIGEPPQADLGALRRTGSAVEDEWRKARDLTEGVAMQLRATVPSINESLRNVLTNPEITTWWDPLNEIGGEIKTFVTEFNRDRRPENRLKETPDGQLTWYNPSQGAATNKFTSKGKLEYWDDILQSDGSTKRVKKELDLQGMFGDLAKSAEFRSTILSLAYLAAAANGQTGRTLSDRDLAFHLNILGSPREGGIRTPEATVAAMTGWFNKMLNGTSIKMQELEKSSLGSDYRKAFNNPTPWAERWLTGTFEEGTNVQKLRPIVHAWQLEKDQDFYQYLQLLVQLQKKGIYTDMDPIRGLDWQEILRSYHLEEEGLPPSSGVVLPPGSGGRITNPPPAVPSTTT